MNELEEKFVFLLNKLLNDDLIAQLITSLQTIAFGNFRVQNSPCRLSAVSILDITNLLASFSWRENQNVSHKKDSS
jgi:hypothetical protein